MGEEAVEADGDGVAHQPVEHDGEDHVAQADAVTPHQEHRSTTATAGTTTNSPVTTCSPTLGRPTGAAETRS